MQQLQIGRNGSIQVCREAKINGKEYRATPKVKDAIDELTDAPTANERSMQLKGHRAG